MGFKSDFFQRVLKRAGNIFHPKALSFVRQVSGPGFLLRSFLTDFFQAPQMVQNGQKIDKKGQQKKTNETSVFWVGAWPVSFFIPVWPHPRLPSVDMTRHGRPRLAIRPITRHGNGHAIWPTAMAGSL